MRKEVRISLIIVVISFAIFGVYDFFNAKRRNIALKNGIIVIAKITDIGGGRGSFTVYVDYSYNGIILHNTIDTVQIDSLEKGEKIRILVSKQYPDEYIKYIGVANK